MKKLILILSGLAFTACGTNYWIQNNSGAPANIAGETIENGQCKEVEDGDFPVSVKTKDEEDNYTVEAANKIGKEDEGAHYYWDGTSGTEVPENKEDDFVEACENWKKPSGEDEGKSPEEAAKSIIGAVNDATANLQAKVKEITDADKLINIGPGPGVPEEAKEKAKERKDAATGHLPDFIGAVEGTITHAEKAAAKEGVSDETKAAVKAAVDAAKAAITAAKKHLTAS